MTDADTVLRMIETVDPTDTAKLGESDLAVTKYLRSGRAYGSLLYPTTRDYHTEYIGDLRVVHTTERAKRQYTRSRDALKAVRPKGWDCGSEREEIDPQTWVGYAREFEGKEWFGTLFRGCAQTEELAELHAIIQAIEYERQLGETGGQAQAND